MTERLKVYVHPATGIVYIDRGATGHATAFPSGRCLVHSRPLDANELAGLVELVEKPATSPLSAEDAYAVEAIDRGDAEIASGVTGVPLETVLAQYPEVK